MISIFKCHFVVKLRYTLRLEHFADVRTYRICFLRVETVYSTGKKMIKWITKQNSILKYHAIPRLFLDFCRKSSSWLHFSSSSNFNLSSNRVKRRVQTWMSQNEAEIKETNATASENSFEATHGPISQLWLNLFYES